MENDKKITAKDIARVFIDLFKDEEEGITNLKLQKLLYYAQGFSFQRFGKPLFDEEIEAWEFGPTVPEVYREYSSYGRDPIRDRAEYILTPEYERLVLDIAREYGKYTSSSLVSLTHKSGTPWQLSFKEGVKHVIIPKEVIKEHFIKAEAPLEEFDIMNFLEAGEIVDLTGGLRGEV